jgi:wobble nucleotide-excising tRNase
MHNRDVHVKNGGDIMSYSQQSSGTHKPKISLSYHPDKFSEDSQEFTITKKVNFIFGRNGTGKTTISDQILSQLSAEYDVYLFKDFGGVVENDRLNAVALGTTNAKIQKEINDLDIEIAEIKKQIEIPEDNNIENLRTKSILTENAYSTKSNKIDSFFSDSARKIKYLSNPQIAKPSYTKSNFQYEIVKANLLSENRIEALKDIIKAEQKADVPNVLFPDIDLSFYLDSTNEVLRSCVAQIQDIPELTDNTDKQNFARRGISIHQRKIGELCAFCGNKISDERWQLLGNYFNDEVKKLENNIDSRIKKIGVELDDVKSIKEIKENLFYDRFKQDIQKLNLQIVAKRNEYKEFLSTLQVALEEKKKKLFIESLPIEIVVPASFKYIEKECEYLVKTHNELSLNLETEQEKAKDVLRYHEIKKMLDEFNYDGESTELAILKAINEEAQQDIEKIKNELQIKQDTRKDLILQTKDESIIADKINKLLASMGIVSFSLKLVKDDGENQKGQYQIKGHNGIVRPITKVSKGEKNIIAFLYFIFSLESVDISSKPKIIVLDDPMTSNDDTMQYLMISEIQKLYRKLSESNYFILFTHNCHFYLNVRPKTTSTYKKNKNEISFYEKYGVYHLLSDGKRTTIKCINKGKQDFKTSYETLWKQLIFLYNADDATPDLMLSPCRKICETYMNFTKKSIDSFYGDNLSSKKLFDVNQHSIDDFEAETNGKTKSEIKDILFELFKYNGAEEHIKNYWPGE